ncbi:MAG: phosphate acyltransferase [Bacteroidota bacterium]|nr:phosphate acyltransferase [Bacteroidota bacterium]
MDLYTELELRSRRKIKTIIFPESYDERIIKGAEEILRSKIAKVILIQCGKNLETVITRDKNLIIIDINFNLQFFNEYHSVRLKKNPGYGLSQSEKDLKDPLTFSCMLLKNKFADGIIAGSQYPTSEVLRNAISIIGISKNNKTVSSFFLFTFPENNIYKDKILAYADCGVIPDPSAEQLSDIAIQTADNFKKLTGLKPKVSFLSFSTKGSAKDKSLEKIIHAYELTKSRKPKLICDGELQFDSAFDADVAKRKNPKGKIKGDSNVFIFPDLNSGNIAYKITERIGGAFATGPIVQGLAMPVMDLSRGCTAADIVNMTKVITNL